MAKIHHTVKKIRQKLEANHACKQTATDNCKWFVWYVAKLSSPAQCAHVAIASSQWTRAKTLCVIIIDAVCARRTSTNIATK